MKKRPGCSLDRLFRVVQSAPPPRPPPLGDEAQTTPRRPRDAIPFLERSAVMTVKKTVRFFLNGRDEERAIAPETTLLELTFGCLRASCRLAAWWA